MAASCDNADSNAAVADIPKLVTCIRVMNSLLTDLGSHFKSSLMEKLTTTMHIKHHFTTAYCSWSNGIVERVCREMVHSLRALSLK